MEFKDYTTEQLKSELKRRVELAKAQNISKKIKVLLNLPIKFYPKLIGIRKTRS